MGVDYIHIENHKKALKEQAKEIIQYAEDNFVLDGDWDDLKQILVKKFIGGK